MAAADRQRGDRLRDFAVAAALFAGSALVFGWVASRRIVDGDEGLSLYAAQLVADGSVPYRDFFYQQMPLLPYLYAFWGKLFGFSFLALRSLSVVLGAATGAGLYAIARQMGFARSTGVAAAVLFASTGLIWGWIPVAKTYAVCSFLLVAAVYLAARAIAQPRPIRSWLVCGGSIGLAIDVRLYFAVCLLPFVVLIFWHSRQTGAALGKRLAAFGLGVLAALTIALVHAWIAPWPFVFDNLLYHGIRSDAGFVGAPGQKWAMISRLFGFPDPFHYHDQVGVQFALLVAMAIAGLAAARSAVSTLSLALFGSLAIACTLPTPTFTQYFCVVVPVLIIAATPAIDALSTRLRSRSIPAALPVLVIAVAYAAFGSESFSSYAIRAEDDFVIRDLRCRKSDHSLERLDHLKNTIDRITAPGDRLYVSWPAYLIGSTRRAADGTENNYGVEIATRLSADEQDTIGVVTEERLFKNAAGSGSDAQPPEVVVLGAFRSRKPPLPETLLAAHDYRPVESIGCATVYRR